MSENEKNGYLMDYISGVEVKATPEEVDAVQVFSKILAIYSYRNYFSYIYSFISYVFR